MVSTVLKLVIAASLGVFGLLAAYLSKPYLHVALEWLSGIGLWGNVVLVLAHVFLSFPVPMGTTPLAIATGFLYGLVKGYVTLILGALIGASVSFYVCRTTMRTWVEEQISLYPPLMSLMRAIDRHAFKVCVMLRSAPIPWGLQNSFLAVSGMRFRLYFFSTWLGLLPEQILFIYTGTTAKDLSEIFTRREATRLETAIVAFQVSVCVFMLIALIYSGRKIFQQAVKEAEDEAKEKINDADDKLKRTS